MPESTANILIWGDTERCPALRHEIPLAIGDPFLYLETDGRRIVLTNALEDERIARVAPDLERILRTELGSDELIASGLPREEIDLELPARAARRVGITAAAVPPEFPVALADHLREAGIQLTVDGARFDRRRRQKTPAELDGIRRAARAAQAGLARAAEILREASIDGQTLRWAGEKVNAESLRAEIRSVCARAGAFCPADIIVRSAGPGAPGGHEAGHGPLPPHTPIEIDLWPRDERSGCYADMTRTFVRGEVGDPIAALHATVLEAHEQACAAVRPGVRGAELYDIACEVFEAAGHPTQRTKPPGQALRHGFYFALGHGVGLEVHEAPALGRAGREELIVGDVIAIEPGTSDPRIGGTRVEDMLLVTDQGADRLTGATPYELVV
jgi:Xaa-Pro aminopeptidase